MDHQLKMSQSCKKSHSAESYTQNQTKTNKKTRTWNHRRIWRSKLTSKMSIAWALLISQYSRWTTMHHLQWAVTPNNLKPVISVSSIVVLTDQGTKTTGPEEDTSLYRRFLQRVLLIGFISAATRKNRNIKPIVSFVQISYWNSLKLVYGD